MLRQMWPHSCLTRHCHGQQRRSERGEVDSLLKTCSRFRGTRNGKSQVKPVVLGEEGRDRDCRRLARSVGVRVWIRGRGSGWGATAVSLPSLGTTGCGTSR